MKNYLCILLIVVTLKVSAQQNFIITATDHYFLPDTSYVTVGDTVRIYSLGYHSITELDSTDWVNNEATDNGGFWVGFGAPSSEDWFVVNNGGKYYFNCYPHASMGMKGVLYVSAGLTGIKKLKPESSLTVWNNILRIRDAKATRAKLYTIEGKMVLNNSLLGSNEVALHNLPLGIYIVALFEGNRLIDFEKVFVN